jgi:hypothetical protein
LLTDDLLVDFLASKDLSQRDKVLLILASSNGTPLSISAIKNIGISHGLRRIEGWNLPRTLGDTKGLAVKVPEGWKLTGPGITHIKTNFLPDDPSSTREIAINLRSHLEKVSNIETREFVEESIRCLEADLKRSAVVMSWVGAISVLYDHVIAHRLADFNTEAKRRFAKWKPAVTRDDLALMQESDFLDILAHLSILGKNVKEDLKNNCLNLRNSCGHPNSYKVGKHKVEAHIETLILNVYEKF